MKWMVVLCTLLTLTGCYRNGRDALETHQVIAEPTKRWIHWQDEEPIDVTKDRVKVEDKAIHCF